MKNQEDRLKNGISFWCAVFPAAVIVGFMIESLRLMGLMHIKGLKKLPRDKKSVLFVSNHPSLWEPIILGGLSFPWYLFHPIKKIPWCTPDQKNYTDTWYWGVFKSRFISVPRGRRHGEIRAINELVKVLRIGGSVILFVEGGRTGKGEKFLYSRSGKRMREIKQGVGRVVCRADCTIVPIWIDGAEKVLPIGACVPRVWRGMTITIGDPIVRERIKNPKKTDYEAATKVVSDALLKTAG